MIRALIVMTLVGLAALVVAVLLVGFLFPVVVFLLKLAFLAVVGWFVLRLFKPELAEDYRRRLFGESGEGVGGAGEGPRP